MYDTLSETVKRTYHTFGSGCAYLAEKRLLQRGPVAVVAAAVIVAVAVVAILAP